LKTKVIDNGYIPNEKQLLAHGRPEKLVMYGGAVGGGKTIWLINELLQLCIDFPGNRVYFCQHELVTFMTNCFPKLMEYLPPALIKRHDRQRREIEFINGSMLAYGGLRPSAAERDLSRVKGSDWGAFAIDEASETQEKYVNMLIRSLRLKLPGGGRPYYKALFSSNPEDCWLKYWFIDGGYIVEPGIFKVKGKPNRVFVQARIDDNAMNLPDDYRETMLESYRDTPGWVSRYIDGNWDSLGEDNYNVFPYRALRAAQGRDAGLIELIDSPIEAGVDVARLGADDSVIALRKGPKIWVAARIQGRHSTGKLREELDRVAAEFAPSMYRIDSTGVGGPIADWLREERDMDGKGDNPRVEDWVAGGTEGIDKERFVNRKAQDAWLFREELMKDGCNIDLPKGEEALSIRSGELAGQFTSIRYKRMSEKLIKLETKDEMRKRGARSPDIAEAIIMACSGLFCKAHTKVRDITFI